MAYPDLLADRPLPALDHAELVRYGRHLSLPEIGPQGQQRLKASRVLLVGTGGLGAPLGLYLAAAGVGHIGLVDGDRVEASNLQRQVLFGASDTGRIKVEVAKERMAGINPHITVETFAQRLDADNAFDLIDGYDVVVDGSDNFPTRYLVNDACVLRGKPCVWGAIQRFEGQVAVFWAPTGPCYRCLFPEPPPPGSVPNCAEAGVLGMLPGMVGSMQANEVVKLLVGVGEPLIGRLLVLDALGAGARTVRLGKDPACPICGPSPRIRSLETAGEACAARIPEPQEPGMSTDADDSIPFEIDVQTLRAWRAAGRDHLLVDVREPYEHEICRIDPSLLLPLGGFVEAARELDPERLIVVHCHHGTRSAQAVAYLRRQGYPRATNLAGGIDAWSSEVDASVPRY